MATLKEFFLAAVLMGVGTTILFTFMISEITAIFLLIVGGAMALFSIGIYIPVLIVSRAMLLFSIILLFTVGGAMAVLFSTDTCIYRSYPRASQLVPAQMEAEQTPVRAQEVAARAPAWPQEAAQTPARAREVAARAPPGAHGAARAPGAGEGIDSNSTGNGTGGSGELAEAQEMVVAIPVWVFLLIVVVEVLEIVHAQEAAMAI